MRYAVIEEPGKVKIKSREVPTIEPEEMLVKVEVCGVCGATDYHFMMGELEDHFPLDSFNSCFGHEGMGIVKEVGSHVHNFKVGDRIGFLGPGYTEYSVVNPKRAVKLPEKILSCEGLAEPLAVVLNTIDHASLSPGDDVIVLGAGFMGLLLVQGLSSAGAGQIIVTDIDNKKLKVARELGATRVFNSQEVDPVKEIQKVVGKEGVRTVIEAAGVPATLRQAGEIAGAGGRIVVHGFYPKPIEIDMFPWHCKELTVINSHPSTDEKFKDLMERAIRNLEMGKFNIKKLITHRFKLEEMPEMSEIMKRKEHFIKMIVEVS